MGWCKGRKGEGDLGSPSSNPHHPQWCQLQGGHSLRREGGDGAVSEAAAVEAPARDPQRPCGQALSPPQVNLGRAIRGTALWGCDQQSLAQDVESRELQVIKINIRAVLIGHAGSVGHEGAPAGEHGFLLAVVYTKGFWE
jgi:hypothetical protein